jgi:TolB-like protein
MKQFMRLVLAVAAVAMLVPAVAAAQAKPVVAVLYFENGSFGKDRADFDALGKGIADILITDLANNPNVRIVERERIQALLTEQNLVKEKTIDAQTAVRLGKIVGAQYMITGMFMSDSKGTLNLTSRVINVETSAITNAMRLPSKGDDVLGLINQLSTKLNTEMKLAALSTGQGNSGAAPASNASAASANAPSPAAPAVAHAAPQSKAAAAEPRATGQVAQASKPNRKMDMKTAMLYSKALEEEDAGNKSKALELYRQVNVAFPEYAPVTSKIKKLS